MKTIFTLSKIALMTVVAFFPLFISAQAPVNDNCSGAIAFPTLTPGGGCTSDTIKTLNATQSSAGCAGTADDDVWYSFVVPAGYTAVNFSITNVSGSTDRVLQFYSGTCGALTSVLCSDPENGSVTNLTPGNTYYVRAYTYSAATSSTFVLCLSLPPANDICSGAIAFPTLLPGGSCSSDTVRTAGASQSAAGCAGTADDDVWYSFVVPSGYTAINFSITNVSGSTDRVVQFYSGTCGAITSVLCSDPENGSVSNLTAGNTYYVRAYTYSAATSSTFVLCLSLPPANDICSGAIAFPTLTPGGSCASVTVNTANSSQSSTGCAGTADDDVWYSFKIPVGYTAVNFANTNISGSTDRVLQFYKGSCSSLTSLLCSDPESGTVTGLIPDSTYYVRAYTYNNSTSSTFSLCLSLPPANDICSGAIAFPPLTTDGSCVTDTVNTSTATQSSAGCAGSADDDVWYSFTIPAGYNSVLFSNTNISGSTDRVLQFYSGICASLNSIKCSDPESGTVTGLTPDTTYYIRAYTYSSATSSRFALCLKLPVLTGENELTTENTFSVYPNPANDFITIKTNGTKTGTVYFITDQLGRKVVTGSIMQEITAVDISRLPKGIYFLFLGEQNNRPIKMVKD